MTNKQGLYVLCKSEQTGMSTCIILERQPLCVCLCPFILLFSVQQTRRYLGV